VVGLDVGATQPALGLGQLGVAQPLHQRRDETARVGKATGGDHRDL